MQEIKFTWGWAANDCIAATACDKAAAAAVGLIPLHGVKVVEAVEEEDPIDAEKGKLNSWVYYLCFKTIFEA